MKSFSFRARLQGRLSDTDADRLYEGLGEEKPSRKGRRAASVFPVQPERVAHARC